MANGKKTFNRLSVMTSMKTKTTFTNNPGRRWRGLKAASLLLLASFALTVSSRANVLSWTGGGGGNAYWNNSANWGFAGVPANGDTVIFPGGAPNLLNTNNLVSLILNQIHFAGAGGGYDIRGNGFTVTNNISVTNSAGANTIEINFALATAPNVLIIVSNGVSLTLLGNVSSSGAGVTKTGTGTLVYAGPSVNGYSGTTQVSGGTLQLNVGGSSAFGGALVIGDGTGTGSPTVQLLQPTEIADTAPITINQGGLLDLNGFDEVISPTLALTAGSITTGAGTLMFSGGTTVTVGSGLSTISGKLNNGGGLCTFAMTGNMIVGAVMSGNATVVKSGLGTLTFSGANTYIGQTVVQQGILVAQNALALGTTGAGTVVSNTATLELAGDITIANEPLTLNGPASPASGARWMWKPASIPGRDRSPIMWTASWMRGARVRNCISTARSSAPADWNCSTAARAAAPTSLRAPRRTRTLAAPRWMPTRPSP